MVLECQWRRGKRADARDTTGTLWLGHEASVTPSEKSMLDEIRDTFHTSKLTFIS